MDSSDDAASSSGGDDRLSWLKDRALGHVLSFLPAEEAARAALLSSRWRNVLAAVHTLTLEEPESPDDDDDDDYDYSYTPPSDPNAPPSFYSTVSAAIIGRQRRRGAVPLRALRVAVEESYSRGDSSMVDQWVSYAVQHAAAEGLDLDLRLLCRSPICYHPYALRRHGKDKRPTDGDENDITVDDMVETPSSMIDAGSESKLNDDDDSTVMSSDEDDDERKKPSGPWWSRPKPEYTATRVIFSCVHLRSLSLSSCRLAPPDTVSLPSLVTLLLSDVSDPGTDVERVIAGCPHLADLTLEACNAVTALSIGGGLRRLALRCCHSLTAVAVNSSELQAFEYRGAVPPTLFLTMHGDGDGGSMRRIAYCKVDICGEEASSSEEEDALVNLRHLLGLFVNAKHLHLESARLGSGLDKSVPMSLPSFSSLLHLEMRGCLPDGDGEDTAGAAAIIGAMSTVLEHAPNLETLSLAFHPQDQERHVWFSDDPEELVDAHHLSYNPHSVLAPPPSAMTMIPCCLRSKVREINLVHYQGSTPQRALAKFLLSNAVAIQKLWCELAEGPMWIQVQLMQEIKGWLINKSADTHFA